MSTRRTSRTRKQVANEVVVSEAAQPSASSSQEQSSTEPSVTAGSEAQSSTQNQQDEGPTLTEYAEELSAAAPNVFGKALNVLAMFNVANEQISNMDPTMRLNTACTFTETHPECWTTEHQRAWNYLLNSRGIELVQLRRGTFYFRCMNVDPDDLNKADDAKFLCLCLWILRQHRCIFQVSLLIPVLAPRHRSLFMHLLKLTKYVHKLEIYEDPFRSSPCDLYPPARASSSDFQGDPWAYKLECLSMLQELGLSTVSLNDEDGDALIRCIEQNKNLVAIIMIDVEMNMQAFVGIIHKVVKLEKLQDFRIKITAKEPKGMFEKTLHLVGEAPILSRLYAHVDYGMESLLTGLQENKTLEELTLEPTITRPSVLAALWAFLEKHPCCRRLKLCIDLSRMPEDFDALNSLEEIMRHSPVRVLLLSGSIINFDQSLRFAEALEGSRLRELHLDGCQIHCQAVPAFINAIKSLRQQKNALFKELNLGAIVGNEQEERDVFRLVTDERVRPWITLALTENVMDISLPWVFRSSEGKGNFTKLSLSFSENIDPDPVFHSLRYAAWSLQSLSIINTAEINTGGAMLLAVVIERSHLLRVLRLHGPISSKGSEQILASLAKSRSVALLTIENWDLKDNVATTFADMLRRNRSLCRLEFYWNDIADYLPFKDHFVRGLSTNMSVVVVKMYRGELRDEFPERDFNVLQYLHRNQMMLTWAVAVALRDGMRLEGRMIADCLQISETSLDFYQRTADISPRTADNRVRLARMATRTHYYELKTAFRVELRSWKKPQARIAAQNLVLSMRSAVLKTLRMEDAYLEDEMTEFGEVPGDACQFQSD